MLRQLQRLSALTTSSVQVRLGRLSSQKARLIQQTIRCGKCYNGLFFIYIFLANTTNRLPTKNTPQGFTSLVSFNSEATVEENEAAMIEALTLVKSGQITYAVRDTVMNDVEVKEGNIIGIAEGQLQAAGDSVDEITTKLVENLVDEDSAIITLFYGEDVSEEEANNLRDELEEKFEDLDIELYYGGQPLYYYLISVE